MALSLQSTVTLNNGVEMPLLGLGVYKAKAGGEAYQAVKAALELGYRHIDTARIYRNEKDVGQALRDSGAPREQVFVTTKLWNADHGYDSALRACHQSLKTLGLDYLDLYLIHWPVEGLRQESWRALTRLYEEGLCRAVGVSNYTVRHLEELLAGSELVPAVNQVEFHPYLYQRELLAFCRERGIQLESYSPLTKGHRLGDPTLVGLAEKYGKTPAQILIRWVLQHEVVVIPKSVHAERIRENAQVFDFDIAPADMAVLDGLNEDLHTAWDPSDVP